MKTSLQYLFFLFFIFVGFLQIEKSYGQQPLIRKISFLEGLTSDVVYDLFVDHKGLLYLGTDKGLITYNGVHFEDIQIPQSLGNAITSLQEDQNGVVWCKNFANQMFYLKNDKLVHDLNVHKLLVKTNTNLVDFCVANQSIYILLQNSIYKYKGGKIVKIYEFKNVNFDYFQTIVYNKIENILYVSSSEQILKFKNDILIKSEFSQKGQKNFEIFKGELCYSFKSITSNSIIGSKNIDLKNLALKNTFINKLSVTDDDLWLCTNKGIYEFDENSQKFKNGILRDIRITDIVKDLEGNHWISSLDQGLFLLPNRKIFELKIDSKLSDKKISFTRISRYQNGHYFLGTNDGRVLECGISGEVIREYNTSWDNTIEFLKIINDTIMTNFGFFKIGDPNSITNPYYFGKALEHDQKGNLLVASPIFGGIIYSNLKGTPNFKNPNNKFKKLNYGNEKTKTLIFREKRTRSVLYHSVEKKYYYGFIDGLFVYDLEGNEFEIKDLLNNSIIAMSMLENSDGSVWVATSQNGLYLIKNKKVIKQITEAHGLSSNNCRRIKKDSSGIWIVTETGFDYYDFETNSLRNAALNLCIKGITINDICIDKNVVSLATNQGVYYFDKNVLNEMTLPRFMFKDFTVNGKKRSIDNDIILDYDENNINIKFNTIHYRSLGNYTYRYRLKGLDDKWYSQNSNSKNINYLALTPGIYKFQINIKIGERYTTIKDVNFEIRKPFWLQYWFLSIVIFGLLSLLYFVYRWAEIKTRKSEELKEQLALSQLIALRSQMNPHFIFNVLNAVQGLIYSNQKSKASDYLGKFSDLMRSILDTSDKKEVTIEKEFETIDLYISLEKARFEDDFEYKITIPEGVDLSQHSIPSMVIQPFVENAIKHGLMHKIGQKKLDIKLELLEDVWCFTVDDNGIGRKASEIINQKIKKHISFATKAIENRVRLINKTNEITIDIEVIDKKTNDDDALGTRIKIYIPLSDK